jgi:hypothetical protein
LSFGILFEDEDGVRGDEEGGGVVIEVDCPFFIFLYYYK